MNCVYDRVNCKTGFVIGGGKKFKQSIKLRLLVRTWK